VSSHQINHLLHEHGLALVFTVVALQAACVPLPGTTALIAAALYASTSHGLPILGVIVAGALGALAGTALGYAIGAWGGERLLTSVAARFKAGPERLQRLRAEFAANGAPWLFVGRFITGMRNISGLVAGASGMPLRRFLPVVAAAATVWATVNSLEYYWFGRALLGASTWLQVVLIAAGLAWTVFSLRLLHRRAARRLALGVPPPVADE
jgi:membrane protein DedA with SNARE-associated domain